MEKNKIVLWSLVGLWGITPCLATFEETEKNVFDMLKMHMKRLDGKPLDLKEDLRGQQTPAQPQAPVNPQVEQKKPAQPIDAEE